MVSASPRIVRRAVAVLVPVIGVLGACGSDDGGDGSPPDVDGRAFVSTEVVGHQLVDGSEIRLTFQDGSVAANAGCNTMNGGYTFDGSTMEVELLATTLMACDDALTDQDAFVSGLLTSGPTVTVDGDELTLTSGEETITMIEDGTAG